MLKPQPEDSAMDDYSLFLETEIERLRAIIAQTPEGKKLNLFERNLKEYRLLGVTGDPVIMPTPATGRVDMSRYGRNGSKAAVIVKASEAFLKVRLKRAQSSEIVEALRDAGIELLEE